MKVLDSLAERYLSLLKKSLLNQLYPENEARIGYLASRGLSNAFPALPQLIHDFLNIKDSDIYDVITSGRKTGGFLRWQGVNEQGQSVETMEMRNFSFTSHTMIGAARLDNIHDCLDRICADRVPGDLIETGVWKGGATIFMRGFLAAHDIGDRNVWVADSFEGLPHPSHEKDEGWDFSDGRFPYLSVGLEEVRELFDRYDLLDDKVRFLKGWFKDTLPTAPIDRLALLRLDGDLYESTMDALDSLYAKVSPGGFVIVDDYNALPQCADAIGDFRTRHDITDELVRIDDVSVFWRKSC